VAQLELLGLTAALFTELRVNCMLLLPAVLETGVKNREILGI